MAFSTEDVRIRFEKHARGRCECCGKELTWENRDKGAAGNWHAHHVFPRKTGIDDSLYNMAVLCKNCHNTRAHEGEWREVQPRFKWDSKVISERK